jgi:hypothetical protein
MSAALNKDTDSHQEFTKGVSFELIRTNVVCLFVRSDDLGYVVEYLLCASLLSGNFFEDSG